MGENFRKLMEIGRAHKKYILLLVVLGVISTILSAMVPFYLRNLLDELEMLTLSQILREIGIILGLYTLSTVIYLYAGFISNFAETKAAAWLKRRLFISTLYAENIKPGDALSRIQSDTEIVGRLGMSLIPAVIIEGFSLAMAVFVVFKLNVYLGLLTLITMPIYGFSMRAFVHRLKIASSNEREKYSKTVTAFKEGLDGRLDAKALNAFEYLISRISKNLDEWVEATKKMAFYQTANYGLQSYLSTILPLTILLAGLLLVKREMAPLSVVIAVFSYLGKVYYPIERFAFLWSAYQRAIPVLNRIWGILEIGESSERSACNPYSFDITLKDVHFSFDDEKEVLRGISAIIPYGKKLGIVGSSGVGKTTLAMLLAGILSPTKGTVSIGGCHPSSILGNSLIYIPSSPHLFTGTVKENIALGMNVNDNDIAKLLELVELGGIDMNTLIEEGGKNLSLGQKQRIALARALVRRPKILILDEATSGIDSETEAKILERLKMMDMTVVVISHRLSTVREMEEIWVLDGGMVTCRGQHNELLQSCRRYRELFKEQQKG
ncbi:ATP-binding cassette domain-containing protein [Thermococcus sp. 101 C5]|uniref:ABC transporter ATP-binding protein n=1 Tax=Thermococcus sp. 101 C5 TaxID=2654197 RepID=UPI00128BA924|nr:ABC transporter ATP-binding protein [Thermococcus sp. 101 C5]MPW39822.1 ATP-binding cassette domain-containing protein [Thermococcus sp. 101 C5]